GLRAAAGGLRGGPGARAVPGAAEAAGRQRGRRAPRRLRRPGGPLRPRPTPARGGVRAGVLGRPAAGAYGRPRPGHAGCFPGGLIGFISNRARKNQVKNSRSQEITQDSSVL
ncbi:unnamed protein product, partial [Heterosigma akashiwo]